MGRFFLTNKEDLYKDALKINEKAGLSISGKFVNNHIKFASYHKRNFSNINFLPIGDHDFFSATGTFIYDGKIGEDALRKAHKQYKQSENLDGIRNNAIGHYALIVKASDFVEVVCDKETQYEIYYYNQGNTWFITDSLYLLGLVKGSEASRLKLLERILQTRNMGSETFLRNVKQLWDYEKLKIGLKQGGLKKKKLPLYDNRKKFSIYNNQHKAVENFTSKIRNIFYNVEQAFDSRIGLQLTGGLDSRTVLSAALSKNLEPTLIYGRGNNGLSNTKEADLDAVLEYSKKFNLPNYIMDWSGELEDYSEKYYKQYLLKYGFRYEVLSCTPSYVREKENRLPKIFDENQYIILAGFGSGFTNSRPWEDDYSDHVSFSDLTREHARTQDFSEGGFLRKKEYIEYMQKQLAGLAQEMPEIHPNPTSNGVPGGEVSIFKLLIHRKPAGKIMNFNNEFSYFLNPLATSPLFRELLRLPDSFRKGNKFQVSVIKTLEPEVFEIPVYSGCQPKRLIGEQVIPDNPLIKRAIKKLLELTPESFSRMIKKLYHEISEDSNNKSINELLEEEFIRGMEKNYPWVSEYFDFNKFDGDIRRLSFLLLYLFALDHMDVEIHESSFGKPNNGSTH